MDDYYNTCHFPQSMIDAILEIWDDHTSDRQAASLARHPHRDSQEVAPLFGLDEQTYLAPLAKSA